MYNSKEIFSNNRLNILLLYKLVYSLVLYFITRKLHLYNFRFNALTFIANMDWIIFKI